MQNGHECKSTTRGRHRHRCPPSDALRSAFGAIVGVMLCFAYRPIDIRPWRRMAHHAWPIHRLPRVHSWRCRDRPRLGVVSGAASQAMRNAQTICNCLDVTCVHRFFDRTVFAALGGVSAAFYVGFVEIDTMKNKLLALGVGGTILAILCCFTPLLPFVLTALGLTGLLGVVYSDAVLLPILAGFLMLTGFAIWRQKTQK